MFKYTSSRRRLIAAVTLLIAAIAAGFAAASPAHAEYTYPHVAFAFSDTADLPFFGKGASHGDDSV